MAQRDGKNAIQPTHLGNLALSGTTPAATGWLDTQEIDAATLVIVANTVTDAGTAAGFSFILEESDTTASVDATTVAANEIIGSLSSLTVTSDSADNVVVGWVGYLGSKRYVRAKATGTAGTDADVSVIAIGSALSTEPRSTVGTSVAAT